MMSNYERRLGDGQVAAEAGDLSKARVAYTDAVRFAEGALERSRALGRLAVVCDRSGDGEQAHKLLIEAVELDRAAAGPQLGAHLHDLGLVLYRAGRAQEAWVPLEESARLCEGDADRALTVELLASAWLDVDELRRAESAWAQLIWLAGQLKQGDALLRAYNGHAESLRRQGRAAEAVTGFERVVKALRDVERPTEAQLHEAGSALHNMGVLVLELNVDQAEGLFREATRCFTAIYGANHPHLARGKAFLGKVAAVRGQAEEAERLWAEAAAMVPEGHAVAAELIPMLRG